MPPTPTTRAPSVLGVYGWVSAPRTALPRVYCPLVCSLGVSAPPCRVVRHTTMPWSSPQSLSTRTPYVRAERARGDLTAPTLHPRTRGVHAERLRSHTRDPCIPARPLTVGSAPAPDTPLPQARRRTRGARRTVLGWPPGPLRLPTAPKTPPRRCFRMYSTLFIPLLKHTSRTRSRAAAPGSGARRAVRAPVGDAAAPFQWITGSMDGGGSRRLLVGTSRRVPQCHG